MAKEYQKKKKNSKLFCFILNLTRALNICLFYGNQPRMKLKEKVKHANNPRI